MAAYLEKHGLSQADAARGTGISTSLICNYLSEPTARGHRDPGLENAFRIQEWTHGEVPAPSWVDPKARKRRTKKAA